MWGAVVLPHLLLTLQVGACDGVVSKVQAPHPGVDLQSAQQSAAEFAWCRLMSLPQQSLLAIGTQMSSRGAADTAAAAASVAAARPAAAPTGLAWKVSPSTETVQVIAGGMAGGCTSPGARGAGGPAAASSSPSPSPATAVRSKTRSIPGARRTSAVPGCSKVCACRAGRALRRLGVEMIDGIAMVLLI